MYLVNSGEEFPDEVMFPVIVKVKNLNLQGPVVVTVAQLVR